MTDEGSNPPQVCLGSPQVENWSDFNQTALLPEYLQGKIRFANSGSPKVTVGGGGCQLHIRMT
jgi:hypothetical protein